MLSLFHRKRPPTAEAPTAPPIEAADGLLRPQSAPSLLAAPRRKRLLQHIWQRTSLSRRQFDLLYLAPLERYAELVQQFPASESHHHAYPGGMLDHGLEIVAYALKLRQSYLLPAGTTPEDQAAQAECWTAATAYAALLHDVGKVAVDLHVEHADGSVWHPWHGPPQRPYRFRYRADRQYALHPAATGLLYARVLDREILDWLSGYPAVWSALLYVLAGHYDRAGVLGELVTQADRASVAQALGGDPARAMAAPKHALQRKLLDGLRYLLKEELKLNQPQASDGWLTEDTLWLVSKTVSDKLRAHLLSQGIDGIPANNTTLFNVMQDHGLLQPTADGKAIWRATVVSDAGWSHSFTLLRLAPALIWERDERPPPFDGSVTAELAEPAAGAPDAAAVPVAAKTTAPVPRGLAAAPMPPSFVDGTAAVADGVAGLLSMLEPTEAMAGEPTTAAPLEPLPAPHEGASLPDAAAAASTEAPPSRAVPSGEHFMRWLRRGIQSHKLIINDAKALVHAVAGTAYLVSPGIFQRYGQEHPYVQVLAKAEDLPDWRWIQRRFEKLQLHRKQPNGLNIWTCEVTGPRKSRQLHGYLLESPAAVLEPLTADNPHLTLKPSMPDRSPRHQT